MTKEKNDIFFDVASAQAAVCGFEAELETKLLIGEVKEKQAARQEYNAAVARGETAARELWGCFVRCLVFRSKFCF